MSRYFKVLLVMALWAGFSQSVVVAADKVLMDPDVEFDQLKQHLISRYDGIVTNLASAEVISMSTIGKEKMEGASPDESSKRFTPWWSTYTAKPLSELPAVTDESVRSLFVRALENSSQIKVFSDLPLIRKTTIQEAQGEFDTHLFADGKYSDINEPVGDDLRTGGPERYKEDSGNINFGLRRKFSPGTNVEIFQGFGKFDSNSTYLNPNQQGTSKTGLSITQPLLKGFGPQYNETMEKLAEIDFSSSSNELRRQLEGHLLEIARSYWGLYMERSVFLQKKKLADKTEDIYNKMKDRVDIDVEPSLLARTKSQMLTHKLDADEALFAILNAQSRIWTLTNDPELANGAGLEFVTGQDPHHRLPEESMEEILTLALLNRPEIDMSVHQLQSAVLRHYRSKNELMPELDLFADTYIKGLEGDYDHSGAWDESWNDGEPSFNVGLRFDYPLANNAAEARELRKRLEIRQLVHQLDTTVTNILLEAQVSYREMIKNHMAMERRYRVMQSTNEEIEALITRIDVQLSKNQEYGTILYQLLDSLERLNHAEIAFSASELTYNLSLYQLLSAKGVLLKDSTVSIEENEENDMPMYQIKLALEDSKQTD